MDNHASPTLSLHKRDESVGFIRLIRNNREHETLKRVCQHLSVLVAIENSSPRPKSRNGHDYNDDVIFPPNNTPAESTAPHSSNVKISRGKENWKRVNSQIVKRLKVENAIKQFKREQVQNNGVQERMVDAVSSNDNTESSLAIQSSTIQYNSIDESSSIVTIDQLFDEAAPFSNDVSKMVSYEQLSKDVQSSKRSKVSPAKEKTTTRGKSVWGYLKGSVTKIKDDSHEGPSVVQNVKPNVPAKPRWHILSRTILTLVRVANILHLLKSAQTPDYSTPASLGSVIFIKQPGPYNDSVSSGSFSTSSENNPTISSNTITDNSTTSGSEPLVDH